MINELPIFISVFFGLTTILTVFLFSKTLKTTSETPPQYKTVLSVVIGWALLQMAISLTGFYKQTDTLPPRLALAAPPAIALIIALFLTKSGKLFIESLDLKALTYLHIVRIPVELTLFWLYQHGQVPELMTFAASNFDIISGITAPFIAYFGFVKKTLNPTIIVLWNFICLGLLFNIVFHAIFSVDSPLQLFAFEQPNRAILYFPFVWLPSVIVPLVLFAHLVVIKRLLKNR